MVFSSIIFLLYFLPFFLLTYFSVGKKYKNAVILAGSIFFYSWGAPKFIFVILFTTLLDFYLVQLMDKTEKEIRRKVILLISVSVNLGLLFYFKYCNFFIENVNGFLSVFDFSQIQWTKLILPIGISFYTFETITYVVDVYRRVHKPLTKFWDYQLYIILFPKLIAGPIIRYHELADQLSDRPNNIDDKLLGFYRFSIGLGKKVLIANQMGVVADMVFGCNYEELDTLTAWVGSLAYTFQIYFDFSGYSDMAIGLARMMGFSFPENFNNPYVSQSVTEFWRRWHMTLGSWMKNYLYIPLGGNKVSKQRLYLNLWLVFLASGLWHGASWSFVFWGAFHGFFLVIERAFFGKVLDKMGKFWSVLITFFIVNIGWIFFRTEKINGAWHYLLKMFEFNFNMPYQFSTDFTFYFIVAIIFSFFTIVPFTQRLQNEVYFNTFSVKKHLTFFPIAILLFLLSVASITSSGFNPFIYFRF